MSKRSSRKTKSSKQPSTNRSPRVAVANARRKPQRLRRTTAVRPSVLTLEDRRLHHPDPLTRPALALRRYAAAFALADRTPRGVIRVGPTVGPTSARAAGTSKPASVFSRQTKSVVSFAMPKKVAICVRRQRRKEVIHAIGKAGAGSRNSRPPRRNEFSDISCR